LAIKLNFKIIVCAISGLTELIYPGRLYLSEVIVATKSAIYPEVLEIVLKFIMN
jgi:hypothetical protein